MNNILLVFFSLSLSGSLLALILLVIKPLTKRRLSQTWQYYIWLIVILRFLLPFTTQVNVIGEMARYFQNVTANSTVAELKSKVSETQDSIATTIPKMPNVYQAVPNTQENETEAPAFRLSDILNNVWVLWLGIALMLLAQKVTSYRNFVRFVKIGARKVTNAHILDIYGVELTDAKVQRPLTLYVNDQVVSPMLIGILRPSIVIPVLKISDDELRHIFRHELTHHRRLDFIYKWIVQIAMCMHWFNPLVYLINKEINRLCELSCDETVIKHLDVDNRIAYGDALVATLKAPGNYNNFVLSITMSENADLVKERLDMMMNYKKKSKWIICISVLLTLLLFCGFTFTGTYTYTTDNGEKNTQSNIPNGTSTTEKEIVKAQEGYKQIVKTLEATYMQNININVAFCTLQFEQASGNTFEAVFIYPENTGVDYKKYLSLRMENDGENNINISTDYNDNDFINNIEGIADNYLMSAILTIKVPQRQYDKVRLNLSAINAEPINFDIDTSRLEIVSGSADISFKTDKAFDSFDIIHYAGNFDLQLKQLSKSMNFDVSVSDFTLSLPNDPQTLSLTVNNKDNSACEMPTTWKQSSKGDTIVYESGNKQHRVNVNNGNHAMFRVNIDGMANQYPDTKESISERTLSTSENLDSDKETAQVYTDINLTQYSKKKHFEAIDGADYFSWGRIDVADNSGYVYQAIIFICNGSDSYVKNFNQALEQLSVAYSNNQNNITGYLDLIRDNRMRNFGVNDFSAIERIIITNTNGIHYEAYVVAVCGSETFMKPYHDFYDKVMDEYCNSKP